MQTEYLELGPIGGALTTMSLSQICCFVLVVQWYDFCLAKEIAHSSEGMDISTPEDLHLRSLIDLGVEMSITLDEWGIYLAIEKSYYYITRIEQLISNKSFAIHAPPMLWVLYVNSPYNRENGQWLCPLAIFFGFGQQSIRPPFSIIYIL